MVDRLQAFRSPEALSRGLAIQVRPTDVFVSTYPKSGTTWLQHVVHGLRSSGSLDFEEISLAVPWLETAHDMGIDPDADQEWFPRAFKAHLDWARIPKGGRYITAFRDPRTVLTSFYRFFEGWFFEPGAISIAEFAQDWFMAGTASGRYWDQVVSWWPAMERADVLALTYEDMIAAPQSVPAVVADFLDLEIPEEVLRLVVRQSSREFMASQVAKFDEHVLRQMKDADWGLPSAGSSAKVRRDASQQTLAADIVEGLDDLWRSEITSVLGFASYAELRAAMPNPLGVSRDP
jgi:hypothetical protein